MRAPLLGLLLASSVSIAALGQAQPGRRLDRTAIRRVILQAQPAFDRCRVVRPVTIDFTIGGNGRAALRNVTGAGLTPAMERCLEKAVRSIRFPASGQSTVVRYPL